VFSYKPPLNILEFIKKLPKGGQKPCFTFVSYAGALSNTFWILKTELEKQNYICIAQQEMLAQGSWTTERAVGKISCENEPSSKTQNTIIHFGKELQNVFNKYCSTGLVEVTPSFSFGWRHVVSWLYNDFVLRYLFTTKVEMDKCIECGLCVNSCPTGRMKFEEFPNPKGKCFGCYRCINICPKDAVEGWLTKNKVRYKGLSSALKILNQKQEQKTKYLK
jgi:ferredoxin